MKKISKKMALLLCLLLAFIAFAGCGQKQNTDTQGEEKTKISIGCMPLNEEAVQVVKELMADKGYEMEVMVFDGNNLPAEALMADEIDCLLLNHLPWINNFNEQNGSELTMVKGFTYATLQICTVLSCSCRSSVSLSSASRAGTTIPFWILPKIQRICKS